MPTIAIKKNKITRISNHLLSIRKIIILIWIVCGHLNIAVGITLQSSEGFVNLISDINTKFPNVSLNIASMIKDASIPLLKNGNIEIEIDNFKNKMLSWYQETCAPSTLAASKTSLEIACNPAI